MGSEGFCICHDCEMRLVEHICQMMRLATISRKKGYESLKNAIEKADLLINKALPKCKKCLKEEKRIEEIESYNTQSSGREARR